MDSNSNSGNFTKKRKYWKKGKQEKPTSVPILQLRTPNSTQIDTSITILETEGIKRKSQQVDELKETKEVGIELGSSFSQVLGLDDRLVTALVTDCKFERMTKVQCDTIEQLLLRKDMHIISKTGSGKTGAFLIPSIQHIIKKSVHSSIRMLVVSPTRELALQIAKEANLFTGRLDNLKVDVVFFI